MTCTQLFYVCLVAVGSFMVAIGAMAWVCVSFARLIYGMSGSNYRMCDRERRDHQDFVARLIEKQTLKPEFAANMHAIERREQRGRDAELQAMEIKQQAPAPPAQPKRGEEGDVRDEVME